MGRGVSPRGGHPGGENPPTDGPFILTPIVELPYCVTLDSVVPTGKSLGPNLVESVFEGYNGTCPVETWSPQLRGVHFTPRCQYSLLRIKVETLRYEGLGFQYKSLFHLRTSFGDTILGHQIE